MSSIPNRSAGTCIAKMTVVSGRQPENHVYYQPIPNAIKDAGELLIVGRSTAKLELFKHLQTHVPAIAARVAIRPTKPRIGFNHRRYS
jgi:hypothetical protein